jgi:hypothetical protein
MVPIPLGLMNALSPTNKVNAQSTITYPFASTPMNRKKSDPAWKITGAHKLSDFIIRVNLYS